MRQRPFPLDHCTASLLQAKTIFGKLLSYLTLILQSTLVLQSIVHYCITLLFLQSVTPHGFRVGMKLEAADKKNNTEITCVATVLDVLGDRILIHFDGWDNIYDYWCDPSSPHIHHVGWCQENGKPLSPPNGKCYLFIFQIPIDL